MRHLAKTIRVTLGGFASAAAVCLALTLGILSASGNAAYAQDQAQAALTPAQISAIQAQVNAAIAAVNGQQFDPAVVDPDVLVWCNCADVVNQNTAVNGQPPTPRCDNPARLAAYANAIADITVALVGTYGPNAASEIASVVLASAMNAGVPSSAAGVGLGRAAQQIAMTNNNAAILVAQVISNEGTGGIGNCFASVVGSQQLAQIALSPPNTTAAGDDTPPPNGAPDAPPVLAATSS